MSIDYTINIRGEKRANNTQTMKHTQWHIKNRYNQWAETNKQITYITT